MAEKVLIIGCGWLGQQLAPVLAAAGYQVFGSRRTQAAAETLPAPIKVSRWIFSRRAPLHSWRFSGCLADLHYSARWPAGWGVGLSAGVATAGAAISGGRDKGRDPY